MRRSLRLTALMSLSLTTHLSLNSTAFSSLGSTQGGPSSGFRLPYFDRDQYMDNLLNFDRDQYIDNLLNTEATNSFSSVKSALDSIDDTKARARFLSEWS